MGGSFRQPLRHAGAAGEDGARSGARRAVRYRLAGHSAAARKGRPRPREYFRLAASISDPEERLRSRAQGSRHRIRGRMAKAGDEMSHWAEYDYVVINTDIEHAFAEVRSILSAERLKRERQTGLTAFVRGLQAKL